MLNNIFVKRAAFAALLAFSSTAFAVENNEADTASKSAGNQPPVTENMQSPVSKSIWDREQLLGDMGGVRPFLENYGVNFGLVETSELLGNTSGGIKRGFEYEGLTTISLQLDTKKAFGSMAGYSMSAHWISTALT